MFWLVGLLWGCFGMFASLWRLFDFGLVGMFGCYIGWFVGMVVTIAVLVVDCCVVAACRVVVCCFAVCLGCMLDGCVCVYAVFAYVSC